MKCSVKAQSKKNRAPFERSAGMERISYLLDMDLIFRRVMARMRATLLCPMVPS